MQTYGLGARGYNQYDGTVENISFQSIETFGDGSVGIQLSKKIGTLTVDGNVTTHGSLGPPGKIALERIPYLPS